MTYDAAQCSQLLADLRRPHATNRDSIWDMRRNVRHRKLKPSIPPGLDDKNLKDFDYRGVLGEFVVTSIKAKLGANRARIATKMRGNSPKREKLGEEIEDWLRGALNELDPNGTGDAQLRDWQSGTGIGWWELEFKKPYVPPSKGEMDGAEYDQVLEDGRMAHGLSCCINPVDPRAIYWSPIDKPENPNVVAKVVNIPLYSIMNSYSAEGFKIAYERESETKGKFVKRNTADAFFGGEIAPVAVQNDWNKMVRIVVIADRENIYHLMFPAPGLSGTSGIAVTDTTFGDTANGASVPQLELLVCYPNPIDRVPFFACIGRLTDDPDPGYRFKPLAVEVLDLLPTVNDIKTMRLMRAWLDMYKPPHMKPRLPDTAPKRDGISQEAPVDWRPDKPIIYDGDFLEIPSPASKDFDVFEGGITEEINTYNRDLRTAMNSGSIGKSTPAWSIMQVNEEEIGLLDEPQNSRAGLYRDVLMAVLRYTKQCATDGPVYVVADSSDKKNPANHIEDMIGIDAKDIDEFFKVGRLEVTIPAERQSQRAAATEYWREVHAEGRISDETYDDRIGIEDPVAEQARRDREAIEKPMRELAYGLGWEYAKEKLRATYGPLVDMVLAGLSGGAPMPTPQGEMAPPMADPMIGPPKLPGMGMGLHPPSLGQRVMANPVVGSAA